MFTEAQPGQPRQSRVTTRPKVLMSLVAVVLVSTASVWQLNGNEQRDDGRGTPYIVDRSDNICGVKLPQRISRPAKVSYDVVLPLTPQIKQLVREKIDPRVRGRHHPDDEGGVSDHVHLQRRPDRESSLQHLEADSPPRQPSDPRHHQASRRRESSSGRDLGRRVVLAPRSRRGSTRRLDRALLFDRVDVFG